MCLVSYKQWLPGFLTSHTFWGVKLSLVFVGRNDTESSWKHKPNKTASAELLPSMWKQSDLRTTWAPLQAFNQRALLGDVSPHGSTLSSHTGRLIVVWSHPSKWQLVPAAALKACAQCCYNKNWSCREEAHRGPMHRLLMQINKLKGWVWSSLGMLTRLCIIK